MKKIITLLFLGLIMSCSVEEDPIQASDEIQQKFAVTELNDCGSELYDFPEGGYLEIQNSNDSVFIHIIADNAYQLSRVRLDIADEYADFPIQGNNNNISLGQMAYAQNFSKDVSSYTFKFAWDYDEDVVLAAHAAFKGDHGVVSGWAGDISGENGKWAYLLYTQKICDDACTDFSAGPDNSITLELSDAAAIESWDEVRKLYLSLLADGVARDGSFDPSIWDLINAFNEAEDPTGDYTTTYTITNGDCTDSVDLTVTVIPDQQDPPICEGVDAGPDNSTTLTQSEAAAIESWDEVRKLYLSLLADGVPRDGKFDPSIWELIYKFQDEPIGDFSTTYTITEGDCTDSVILTVTVVPDQQDPVCEGVDAGADNMKEMTVSAAAAIESWDEVRKLYLSLLETGVPRDGAFDPSIWDLINAFNNADDPTGDYTTTYTITEGDCSDSVQLTIRVVPD